MLLPWSISTMNQTKYYSKKATGECKKCMPKMHFAIEQLPEEVFLHSMQYVNACHEQRVGSLSQQSPGHYGKFWNIL